MNKRTNYNFRQPNIENAGLNQIDAYLIACELLHNLSLERKHRPWWKFWKPRWFIHHEPLRNDAARFLRKVKYKGMRLHGFHMVGEEQQ